jgi:hypothetical protein
MSVDSTASPMISNSDITRKIEAAKIALADHLEKTENDCLKGFEIISINPRPFSTIVHLRMITPKVNKRLVMKTVNHHPVNRAITDRENQAVVEYNILRDLYPKFLKVEKCSVPAPVLVIPEIETYLTEFVEGNLLIEELRWTRRFSSKKKFIELQDHFYNSGRWLRYFQEITGVCEVGSEALNSVIERSESRLHLIGESSHPSCPKNLLGKVKTFLYDQLRELSGKKMLVSGRHSDFHPLNILVGKHGVTVIDFTGYQQDCVAVDVLKMMVHLEDEKRSLTASSRRVENLKDKFLEGYGKLPVVPLPALVICEAMQRIVSIWGNISNPKNHFHHYIEGNFRVKAHVSWLLNERKRRLLWPS